MKKLYFLLFLFFSGIAWGQPAVKIYAYSQATTPGIIPAGTDPNLNKQPESAVNYYFFAAYTGTASIQFSDVWIKGKSYQTQTEKISGTPVIKTNNTIPDEPVNTVLVPATKRRVTAISPVGSPGNKSIRKSWFLNMLNRSELIVSYFYNGKKYFIPVKKINVLEPVAGQ